MYFKLRDQHKQQLNKDEECDDVQSLKQAILRQLLKRKEPAGLNGLCRPRFLYYFGLKLVWHSFDLIFRHMQRYHFLYKL